MLCVFVANVVNAEVVDQEGEACWAGFVFPKSRCNSALVVSVVIEACLKKLLCNDVSWVDPAEDGAAADDGCQEEPPKGAPRRDDLSDRRCAALLRSRSWQKVDNYLTTVVVVSYQLS